MMMAGFVGAFLTTALLDDDLLGVTEKDPRIKLKKSNGFRWFGSLALLCTQLPAFLTHMLPAAIRWCWVIVPFEVFWTVGVVTIFGQNVVQLGASVKEWLKLSCDVGLSRGARFEYLCRAMIARVLVPALEPVLCVWRRIGLVKFGSAVGPFKRGVLLQIAILLKA